MSLHRYMSEDELDALSRPINGREPKAEWDGLAEPKAAMLGIDAADLIGLEIPPLRMIIPDILAAGTSILASPPKIGKSCLVYQIVVEVALGGSLFSRRVESGSCLYFALEDGSLRGQTRLAAALAGRTMPRGRLEIRWSAEHKIGSGLEQDIERWLDDHPDAAVVAIDTLQRVRERTNGKRGAYEVDVDDLGRLQAVFRDRRVALAVVHHTHKATGDDFLSSVSGTYGITGSADTILVVARKRLERYGKLIVTGRDLAEIEIPVQFDGLVWSDAPAVVSEASFERSEVYEVIKAYGPIFPAEIARRLGKERSSVHHLVDGLVSGGVVARTGKGYINTVGTPINIPLHYTHSESEQSD